jgi:hypothetical protein
MIPQMARLIGRQMVRRIGSIDVMIWIPFDPR